MDIQKAITDQTHVSLQLATHVSSTQANNSNLVLSPLSIQLVLSLIAAGSSGPTRHQLLTFLKSDSSDDLNKLSSELVSLVFADGGPAGGPKLSFVNGVWVEHTLPFKPSFEEVVGSVYNASSNQVDFLNKAAEVASKVNSWAEKQTNGLIKELLPPGSVDNSTRLIFANALYFKGTWADKFDASETKEDDFHLLDGSSVKVPFMTTHTKQFIRASDGFKVLGLPYKQGQDKRSFSMYILLPDTKDGLSSLVQKLSSPQSDFLTQHLPVNKVRVGNFKLPKFKISFGFEASKVLKSLGVELPFVGGGLTEMVASPMAQNLYVSSINHKSFIEVNEEGTEAAAATGAVVSQRSLDMSEEDFVADHPFLFLIREDMTGVVLFVGHVMNPLLN